MSKHIIAVAGNPNCGKTTLFNALTGARQRVGNWPGVTVDRKTGEYVREGVAIQVVDLPGIYSLSAASLDEEVSRGYILSGEADLVVNIVDASNLERNLYLTVQLLEMKVPLLVVLNMMDVADKRGIRIDVPGLSRQLGCPVVPVVAARGEGVEALKSAVHKAVKEKPVSDREVVFAPEVENAIRDLISRTEKKASELNLDPRWVAVKLLEEDPRICEVFRGVADTVLKRHLKGIEEKTGDEADILVADSRYEIIRKITQGTVRKTGRASRDLSDRIDAVVLNRALGIPVFLVAMYLMFMITINVGGAFIDFFDILAGTLFVDGFGRLLSVLSAPQWLEALLAGGIGGSLQTMATFIPPVGFMFLCLSFLEDSGYMARAAFVMDRFMRTVGLPGKSFVPMLVGFGCNVPAIMATRTLESQRDRTLTILMNPFMSCGARLPVYALFAAAFFPAGGQNLVFGLYLLGIGFAVLTGLVLKHTLLKGEITPFVMELPPYHLPTARGVLLRARDRLKTFMFRAGQVIVPVVVVLSFLNSMGTDGTFGNEDGNRSVLSSIGKSMTPAFAPMGIEEDNWPAAVGIFTGVFAKEAVVGTLDSLYGQMGEEAAAGGEEEEAFSFWGGIGEAFATIPENLAGVAGTLLDPLGLSVGDVSTVETASEEQEVAVGTFGAMTRLFDGRIGAFAYLLFILLYFPCVAAIAAVYRETNLKWTLFAGAWTMGLAYMAATVFYQAGTLTRHPAESATWILAMLITFTLVVLAMYAAGRESLRPRAGTALPGTSRA